MRTNWKFLLVVGALGCGRTTETYKLSANLVAAKADTCEECSVALVLEAVPVSGGPPRRFYRDIGKDAAFTYRWGVEQTVEIEHWREPVPSGVADDTGERAKLVRVVGSAPVPEARFDLAFQSWPPGTFSLRLERDGARLRLSDYSSSVLIDCPEPTLCDQAVGFKLGDTPFVLTLAHAPIEGNPLTLKAVRSP